MITNSYNTEVPTELMESEEYDEDGLSNIGIVLGDTIVLTALIFFIARESVLSFTRRKN